MEMLTLEGLGMINLLSATFHFLKLHPHLLIPPRPRATSLPAPPLNLVSNYFIAQLLDTMSVGQHSLHFPAAKV